MIFRTLKDCDGNEIEQSEVKNSYGPSLRDSNKHNTVLAAYTSRGRVEGILPSSNQQITGYFNKQTEFLTGSKRKRSVVNERVQRQASNLTNLTDLVLTESINNPLLCLISGEILLFQINQDDFTSAYHYPVYVKDHLLNSNPAFDFGAFRQLADLIESGVDIAFFVHVFDEPGTFVFKDNIVATSETIVVVVPSGTLCERDGTDFRVYPVTDVNLAQYGVADVPVVNVEPNFTVITIVLLATAFLVIFMVLASYIWRPISNNDIPECIKPKYQRVDAPIIYNNQMTGDLDNLEKRGAGVDLSYIEGSQVLPNKPFLLENFNVRTFYDKLEDQNLHVATHLTRQKKDMQGFYDRIIQQTEGLKALISEAQVISTVEKSRHFEGEKILSLTERGEPVGSDSPKPFQFQPGSCDNVDELTAIIKDLINKLSNFKSTSLKRPTSAKDQYKAIQNNKLRSDILHDELQSSVEIIEKQVSMHRFIGIYNFVGVYTCVYP